MQAMVDEAEAPVVERKYKEKVESPEEKGYRVDRKRKRSDIKKRRQNFDF